MFQVAITPSANGNNDYAFHDLLDNLPEDRIPMAKNGNKFDLYGEIQRRRNGIYSGTFSLIQASEIPPKARLGEEPEDLDLEDDEGLVHFTSFIYDSTNSIILVQNNRNGITASGIAAYFQRNFSHEIRKIEFRVVINPAGIEKLQEVSEIRKMNLTIAGVEGGGILANDGVKRAVGELSSFADTSNAHTVNISLSMGYNQGSLNRNLIQRLFRAIGRSDQYGTVTKMEIVGRESDEDALRTIDFITNKVIIDVPLRNYRHYNDTVITRVITDSIGQYDLIRGEITTTYRVKNPES